MFWTYFQYHLATRPEISSRGTGRIPERIQVCDNYILAVVDEANKWHFFYYDIDFIATGGDKGFNERWDHKLMHGEI